MQRVGRDGAGDGRCRASALAAGERQSFLDAQRHADVATSARVAAPRARRCRRRGASESRGRSGCPGSAMRTPRARRRSARDGIAGAGDARSRGCRCPARCCRCRRARTRGLSCACRPQSLRSCLIQVCAVRNDKCRSRAYVLSVTESAPPRESRRDPAGPSASIRRCATRARPSARSRSCSCCSSARRAGRTRPRH